jgi:hypothetical protein
VSYSHVYRYQTREEMFDCLKMVYLIAQSSCSVRTFP